MWDWRSYAKTTNDNVIVMMINVFFVIVVKDTVRVKTEYFSKKFFFS